jgi:hypothetical protein
MRGVCECSDILYLDQIMTPKSTRYVFIMLVHHSSFHPVAVAYECRGVLESEVQRKNN